MINGKVVAIDARMVEMSGIGTYIQHLLGQGIYDVAIGSEALIRKYDPDVKVIPFEAPIYKLREQVCFPGAELRRAGVDLVHFPHYNVPVAYHGPFVVTVHDLTHILLPEFLGSRLKYRYARFLMGRALRRSRHVFTVSENSRKDICRIFAIPNDKVTVTYNAVDSDFRPRPKEETDYLYEKYSIPRDKRLLLYVGNLKPHKNLGRLLEALALLEDRQDYCLILAGKAFSSLSLQAREDSLGISGLVVHTGLVDKEDLVGLYSLADLFVFPSLYEGFGLPPLEAMACGTPVIAADNSSIPEVVGDAAILVNGVNSEEIRDAISGLFADGALREDLVRRGLLQTEKFSWESSVSATRSCLALVLK